MNGEFPLPCVLEIGDLRVALHPTENGPTTLLWDPAHVRFLSADRVDTAEVAITVHRGPLPRSLRPSADSAQLDNDLWRLYESPGRVAIETLAIPTRDVDLWLTLHPGFRSGDLYLGLAPDEPPYPLGYPITPVLWTLLLGRERGLIVHSCGIDDRGAGLLFPGMSGAGKSTTARLWDGTPGATILSDDRMILRHDSETDTIWMYGTPWHGDAEKAVAARVPLERIFILRHGEAAHRVFPLTAAAAAAEIVVRATPPVWDSAGVAFTLSFLEQVLARTPAAILAALPTKDVVAFVRRCRSE